MRRFTLTGEHVALLRHACVRWDSSEYGAPAIDSKRPYGNSSVAVDMAHILDVEFVQGEWGPELPAHAKSRLRRLHEETETALQIVLATGRMEPGDYEADDYSRAWRKAG